MPTLDPEQLLIREMREDEAPIVLELLKDGFKDTENRLILYVLTRPLALLLMAVVSSGLRFFLNSFVVALVLPVLLTVVALKLLLWRSPDLKHLHAYYSASHRGLWVAVYDDDDVCGCVALEPLDREPHTAELKRLAVSRWYQRSGVGRCLLHFLEAQARAQGFRFLVAQVSVVAKAAIGLFENTGYSSMEQVELSLRKRMKASVAQFSKMLTRKLSSEDTRTASEEVKSEQAERTSLTEPSPTSKKKKIFSAFTLPGLKTKDKGPSFVEELTDQAVAVGQSLTLSCRTSSHSFSGIGWFKDGAAICSTDRILISSTLKRFQLLTVLSATATDFGVYTCKAVSSHGDVSTSCTIRKAEAPSNIPAPDILEVLEDGVQLAWEAVELNHPVTYTVLCKKDDGEWKTLASDIPACCYTVEHLPRGLVYSFRIACVSPAGVGPYSYPTPKVKIGEEDQAAFQAQEEENRMAAPPTHQTYAFQTEIKRGRFSIIKQCREKFSGNPLAAKIIPYQPEEKDAILQEYQILRKLHHANIGQLQGAYVSPRHLVLIVELCVGPELLHALAGRTSYSEVQVRDYLWQILSAVEYLHKQDILHLDLRSENMVIVEPNLLKLLDFGNAHFYSPDQILTVDGCTDYVETMASELVTEKGAVPQTDIWAIGVTAFIMLSAEYPISSEAACDFGRLVKRDKIRLNKCYAGLSGGAINFLQSTLSLNPWRRPTATECLQSSWLQETGLDEHQQATVTFSTTKLRNFVAERERKRVLLSSKYGVTAV